MAQSVDLCLPSAFCMGYGNLYIGSFFTTTTSMEAFLSPSSSSSSQSPHSFELLDSSPSSSGLVETFPYGDLWDMSTLDTPSSVDFKASTSIRKRAALSELDEISQLEAFPMLPKRLCEITARDCRRASSISSRDSSTSMPDEINANSHEINANHALTNGDFGTTMEDASAPCSDLEDVLDILLEAASAESSPISHESSEVELNYLNRDSKMKINGGNYGLGSGLEKGASEAKVVSLQQLLSGKETNKTAPHYTLEDLKHEQGSSRWAGPTLLDIESALALRGSPSTPTSNSSISSPFGHPLRNYWSIKDILKEDTAAAPHSCKEEPSLLLEEDDKSSAWSRLQKRNLLEPRYTVKVRCEEDAVSDGYRWRKYGQKTIKNSPYPRSYYRCSSGKCSVKKQVERCHEDAGLLVVTYAGIHLHHRPNSLHPHLGMSSSQQVVDPHTWSSLSPHSCVASPATNPLVTPLSQFLFLPSSPPLLPPLSQKNYPLTPPLTTPTPPLFNTTTKLSIK